MNRRKFLQALFAIPVIAAPLLAPQAITLATDGTDALTLGRGRPLYVVEVDHERGIMTLSDAPPTPEQLAKGGRARRVQVALYESAQLNRFTFGPVVLSS